MPDYFHVETRTCGVFLSAGRALAKRRGKTRPVLTQSPWERLQPGGLISLARLQKLATEAAPANAGYPKLPPLYASSGRPTIPLPVTIASHSPAGVTSNTGINARHPSANTPPPATPT